MRSIKPSSNTISNPKTKRTPRKRKSTTTGDAIITDTRAQLSNKLTDHHDGNALVTPNTSKRRKSYAQSKVLPAFACSSCGKTDVPLMQGGSKPCVILMLPVRYLQSNDEHRILSIMLRRSPFTNVICASSSIATTPIRDDCTTPNQLHQSSY